MLPNFLVVGCPRCGTTSLCNYLGQHPDVFMSPVKEPGFLTAPFTCREFRGPGDDRRRKRIITRYEDYCALFERVRGERAVGEGTVNTYYYAEEAAGRIKEFLGNPRIIITLRNPVDRAFSAYWLRRRDGREHVSFEEAIAMEPERMQAGWMHPWFLVDMGRYASRIRILRRHFAHVKVCLFDDLRRDPAALLRECYTFLGVDPAFVPLSTVHNRSGAPRSMALSNLFDHKSPLQKTIRTIGSLLLGEHRWVILRERTRVLNMKPVTMKPETRKQLTAVLHDEILDLQELIGRDLSHWL